jgi:hypothetical protein
MLIEQSQWSEYLAELTRQAEGYDVSIEVLAPDLGDQVAVRLARLSALAFDPREGIAVAVSDPEGHDELLRHVVAQPTRLEATDEIGVPNTLLVEDAGGVKTLVRLLQPER